MKRICFVISAIATVALVACNKDLEQIQEENNIEETEIVKAVVNEPVTKSDYSISGSTASFSWSTNDAFYRLVRKYSGETYSNYDHYTYNTDNSTINGAEADFYGTVVDASSYEDTGFALYPAGKSNGANFTHSSSSTLTFTLNETLTYDDSNPLKDIVPMVGKLTDGVYVFKPVTGVIAISATGIPSTATKISLSSTSGGFSGTSVTMTSKTDATYVTSINDLVGPDSAGLLGSWFTAGTAKTFSFSGLEESGTYTYYFPAPIATYTDLTITLSNDSDEVLGIVTASGISLAVSRAKIYPISTVIDFSQANYANVAISGDASSFSAYIESWSSAISTVKVAVAATESDAIAAAASGSSITAVGESNGVAVSGSLTSSGLYYLGYVAYGLSDNEILSGSIPVYFISSSDATALLGTYAFSSIYGLVHYYRKAWVDFSSTDVNNLVLQVSSDPTKGNVQLTKVFGFGADGTTSSYIVTGPIDGTSSDLTGTFSSGTGAYGIFDGSNLVFNHSDQSPYLTYNDTNVYFKEQNATSTSFAFTANETTATLTSTTTTAKILYLDGSDNQNANNCIIYINAAGASSGYLTATKAL